MVRFLLLTEKAGRQIVLACDLFARADLATEEGRARARHRAIALTTLASAFARGVSIATTLISVPLTLHYLGAERYGMWMTLSAFSLLLSVADFGLGNSVLTAVAHSAGRRDKAELLSQVSSAYGAMGLITVVMLAMVALVYPLIPWARLFNVSTTLAASEAGPAAAVFFVILAITGPIGLVNRIQSGLQEGFRSNLWQSAANVAALVALVVATEAKASLPWLVLALTGTPVLVALVNGIDFFLYRRPDLRPRLSYFEGRAIRQLSSDGALFLILQVCAAVMFQSNAIIVAQVLDAKAVAAFAVPDRLSGVISVIQIMVLMPLWPAYGDAAAQGDIAWVRRTLRRSLILSVASAVVLSAAFVVLGPALISWWVGDSIVVPFALIACLGVWKVIEAVGNAVAMFLNGANQLTIQAGCAVTVAIASIALKIWLTGRFGVTGIPMGMILSYSIFALPFLGFATRYSLRRISSGQTGFGGPNP